VEALVPALLAGAVLQVLDGAAALRLKPHAVLLIVGISCAAAACAGALVAPTLAPNAGALLVGLALVLAGAGACLPSRKRVRTSAPTAWLPALSALLGGRLAFATFALAAATRSPWLTGMGAWIGASAALMLQAQLPADRTTSNPLRLAIAVFPLVAGAVISLDALRLI
jgi:uncharacterized membrane protein HdeD (DUF308 family)